MAVKLYNPGSRLENLFLAPLRTSTEIQLSKEAEHFIMNMSAWVPVSYMIPKGGHVIQKVL